MTQEPCKRIVSRGEYAQIQGKKFLLWMNILVWIIFIGAVVYSTGSFRLDHMMPLARMIFVVTIFAALIFAWWQMCQSSKEIRDIEKVLPFTRANTADLPAEESLVRASQEPLQAQEMVLLRAAIETTERQEEELLRALGEQE